MAQLIDGRLATPRQGSGQAGSRPSSSGVGGPASVAQKIQREHRSCFDSSWELRKGVDVAELQDLPQEFWSSKPAVFTITTVDIEIEAVNAPG